MLIAKVSIAKVWHTMGEWRARAWIVMVEYIERSGSDWIEEGEDIAMVDWVGWGRMTVSSNEVEDIEEEEGDWNGAEDRGLGTWVGRNQKWAARR